MKNLRFFSYLLILVLLFSVGCKQKKEIAISAGNEAVTKQDFETRLREASNYYDKSFIETEQGKNQIADGMMKEAVMLEIAKKQGYDKKDDYLTKSKNFERQTLIADLIRDLRETGDLKLTEDDVRKVYEADKAYYDSPKEVKVAHILVTDKALADSLLQQLKAGADFAVLASSNSLDKSSAANGGELNWFAKGDMVPVFEKAAFDLKELGTLSEVIKSDFGYHIIKKLGDRIGTPIPFENVKMKLGRILEKEKFDTWFEKEKSKLKVKINKNIIESVKLENK